MLLFQSKMSGQESILEVWPGLAALNRSAHDLWLGIVKIQDMPGAYVSAQILFLRQQPWISQPVFYLKPA